MRVAIFTDTAAPQRNGVVQSIERQMRILRRDGHSVFSVSSSEFEVDFPINDWKVFRTQDVNYSLRLPKGILRKFRSLPEFDIAHIHTPFAFGIFGLMEAKRRNANCIYTYHTDFSKYFQYVPVISRCIVKNLYRRSYSKFLGNFDRIIYPSQHSYLTAIQSLRIEKSAGTVIPSPAFSELPVLRPKCESGRFDICCVGRISSEKNIYLMAETIKEVLRKRPSTKWLIIGKGKEMAPFKNQFSRDELNGIKFVDELPNEQVREKLGASRVFLQTSVSETQGLVVQEAWSVGTPVVLADSPAAREFVSDGQNGWIEDPVAEKLSARLLEVLDQHLDVSKEVINSCTEAAARFSPLDWKTAYYQAVGGDLL